MIKTILACILPLTAFSFPHITPEVAEQEDPSILYRLKGILIVNDWNLVRQDPVDEIAGVQTRGVGLLEDNPDFLASLNKQFVGKPLTQTTVGVIKQSIADFYESKDYPLAIVNVPKQHMSSGVLQLVVSETVLGEVRCKGNKYVLSNYLKKYIRAEPGKTISSKELLKDLAFINHNPFRRTDAILTPGKKAGIADIELVTVDRWPYRAYVGADNSGTISTMRNRIFFGVNLGKTIVDDSEVSYQYTTAPNGSKYYSHTGMVRVPLPNIRHIFQAFGGYNSVEPMKLEGSKSNGISWEVGLRYRIPVFDGLGTMQEVVLGYDFKEVESKARPSHSDTAPHFPKFHGHADISQFMAGYNLGTRNRLRKISLNMELFVSPGNMTSQNNGHAYKHLWKGANAHYAYFKIVHSLLQEIASGWRFSYNISGQLATTHLLPSEQMTLTGYNAVRGYEERIVNVDNGLLVNLTVEAPHFSPAHWLGWCKHYDDLSFFLFCDAGFGGSYHSQPYQSGSQSLGSFGPGIRYGLSRFVSANLDYGFHLWHTGFKRNTGSRYNFGLIFSF